MHDPRNTHPQPTPDLSAALAAAIAGQIDYQHLARCIVAEMRDMSPLEGGKGGEALDPDTPYPVTAIRKELGKRGRPMAHMTFQRNYLTGNPPLLTLIPGPNRRQLYVRLGDYWEKVKSQAEQKKNK